MIERLGIIYELSCKDNGFNMFGSTIRKDYIRKSQHITSLRKNTHGNTILQNCYNKYGEESIVYDVVQRDIPELILRNVENIWIGANCARAEDEKLGMNLRDAEECRWSQESKDKISATLKGKPMPFIYSEKDRQRLIERNYSKIYQYSISGDFIKEWKSHESVYNYYKTKIGSLQGKIDLDGKLYLGFIWKSKYLGNKVNKYTTTKKGREIVQYNLKGEILGSYKSLTEASKATGVPIPTINNHINRGIIRPKKYLFKSKY